MPSVLPVRSRTSIIFSASAGSSCHWLSAKHMLTMLHGFYGNLRVQIVGQADMYNIDFRVIQYPVILCLRVWDAVGFCGGCGTLRANITGDNTLGVLDIFQGLEMIFWRSYHSR